MTITEATNRLLKEKQFSGYPYLGITRKAWVEYDRTSNYLIYERTYNRLNYKLYPSSSGYYPNFDSIMATDWVLVKEITKIDYEE